MSTSIADLKKRQVDKKVPMKEIMAMAPKQRVKTMITQHADQLKAALPRHLTLARMESVCLQAAMTTPELLECYTPSLFGAMIKCSQLGLEPNNALGQAYLVPFKNKKKNRTDVQVIMGYRGMIDLARRSGNIVSLQAQAVREHDEFEFEWGINEKLRHVPADGDRGEITHFYAYAKLQDGGVQFDRQSKADMDKLMATTQSGGRYGPWKDSYEQMGRKSMIRRLFNYLPTSIEMQQAITLDSTGESQVQGLDNILDDVEYEVMESGAVDNDVPVDGNGEIFDDALHQSDADGNPIYNQDQSFRKKRKAAAQQQEQEPEQQQAAAPEQEQEQEQEQGQGETPSEPNWEME